MTHDQIRAGDEARLRELEQQAKATASEARDELMAMAAAMPGPEDIAELTEEEESALASQFVNRDLNRVNWLHNFVQLASQENLVDAARRRYERQFEDGDGWGMSWLGQFEEALGNSDQARECFVRLAESEPSPDLGSEALVEWTKPRLEALRRLAMMADLDGKLLEADAWGLRRAELVRSVPEAEEPSGFTPEMVADATAGESTLGFPSRLRPFVRALAEVDITEARRLLANVPRRYALFELEGLSIHIHEGDTAVEFPADIDDEALRDLSGLSALLDVEDLPRGVTYTWDAGEWRAVVR